MHKKYKSVTKENKNGQTQPKELMSSPSGLSIMTLSGRCDERSKQGQRAAGGRTSLNGGPLIVSNPLPSNRNIFHSHRWLTVFSRLSNHPPSSHSDSPHN